MALDLDYGVRLSYALHEVGVKWLEECLPPDDYWGQAELRARMPPDMLLTSGEHEAGLQGFRMLIDMRCCDIVQPDITWAGGLSEVLRIADYADAHGVRWCLMVRTVQLSLCPGAALDFVEFLVMSPNGDALAPTFGRCSRRTAPSPRPDHCARTTWLALT
jgi:L-rhamnonate dehydratase